MGKKSTAERRAGPKPSTEAEIERVDWSELGARLDHRPVPGGYRIRVQLEEKGAGVDSVHSAHFDAEFEFGKARKRPLDSSVATPRHCPPWP